MPGARAGPWILLSVLAVCTAMAVTFAGESGNTSEKITETASLKRIPPEHYRFVSISERFFARYPPEEARRLVCIVEKVAGVDPEQNPLISLYVEKDVENTEFYISEIVVPSIGEKRHFLSLRKRVVVISNDSLEVIGRICRGGE
ncbi:MAG: hypothetical protein ACE5JA_02120 [bacterium]